MIDRTNKETIRAMLEAMPIETMVIGAKDQVIGWTKHGSRLFHRPMTSMGLNFRDCHPEKSLPNGREDRGGRRSGQRDLSVREL
jgi:DUF438 domain-containing protein